MIGLFLDYSTPNKNKDFIYCMFFLFIVKTVLLILIIVFTLNIWITKDHCIVQIRNRYTELNLLFLNNTFQMLDWRSFCVSL